MTECGNAEMRDRLPELLDDVGATADRASVRAHVESCGHCRAELALLSAARSAIPVPYVDASRIAGAIPPYQPSRWRRAGGSPAFRIAAGLLLVAGLGTVMTRPNERATPDTADVRTALVTSELPVGAPLGELTDADLAALIEEIDAFEALPSVESDVVVIPAFERGGA